MGALAHAIFPGSGSAGLVWQPAAAELPGSIVLPLPEERSVPAIAVALSPQVEALPRPRILIGSSLGALVALEVARRIGADALVLIAAGFGIEVHPSVLARIAADPPGLLPAMARAVLAPSSPTELADLVARDFEVRGSAALLTHMEVLAGHRPEPLPHPPPTVVLAGWRIRACL